MSAEICACSVEDRSRRVLMVRRLHPAVTMQSLLQAFGQFGCITGCKVFTHKSGRSAGCASVEFASHQAACSAFKDLQGTQLHGKGIHLQWFDHTLSCSPNKTAGQHTEAALSPMGTDATAHTSAFGRASCSGGGYAAPHQPATPHGKPAPAAHMLQSPFGHLASSTHNSYCNGAAVAAAAAAAAAAAHQQQLVQEHQRQQHVAATAALLANSGQMMQYPQLHRQVSAPSSTCMGQLPALQIPTSPQTSLGGALEALISPGLGHAFARHDSSRDMLQGQAAQQDPAAVAAAAAAAVANLTAAMAAANIPMSGQDGNSLAALQQLATMQQQQQQQHLACLALQQINQQRQQQDAQMSSPLSPAHHLPHSQPQQAYALAAALHDQQRQQQQQQMQQRVSGQQPAGAQSKLQLARSMPAELGTSLGSSCSSQGQLHSNSLLDLVQAVAAQQQEQRAVAGPAPQQPQVSPFAMQNEPGTPGVLDSGSDLTASAAEPAAAGCAGAESTEAPAEADAVPASVRSLKAQERHHAKKQLFWEEDCREHSFTLLPNSGSNSRGCISENGAAAAAAAAAAGGSSPLRCRGLHGSAGRLPVLPGAGAAAEGQGLGRVSKTDDTAAAAQDVDMLAAAAAMAAGAAASSGYALAHASCWTGQEQLPLDVLTPELLASLNLYPSEADPCGSPLLQQSSSSAALAAAAAAFQRQQGDSMRPQMQFSVPLDSYEAAAADDLALQLASLRVKDTRASDSQVMLGNSHLSGMNAGVRLSSPSLPGTYSPGLRAADAAAAAAAAAQMWQQAVLANSTSNHGLQQQRHQLERSSAPHITAEETAGLPASEAFKNKHKQQLQLELPDYDMVSAPLTSTRGASTSCAGEGFDQLITTEVMPESPAAAALHSPLDVHAAMMAAAAAATTRSSANGAAIGANPSSWADWSSMAALLSPAHFSSLAGRRFTDFGTPGMGFDDAAAGSGMGPMQQQQHSRSMAGYGPSAGAAAAAGYGLNRRATTSALLGSSVRGLATVSEQHQQGLGPATSTAGALQRTTLGQEQQEAAGNHRLLDKTRHGSLCLDTHPQLLPLQLGLQLQSGLSDGWDGGCSDLAGDVGSFTVNSPSGTINISGIPSSGALKRGPLSEGGALYSSGSFTFQPPVLLQQQQQQSRLGGAAGAENGGSSTGSGAGGCSSSSAMITEPFSMPAFFRNGRNSGSSAPGNQQQAAAAAARTASGCADGSTPAAAGSPTKSSMSAVLPTVSMPNLSECGQQQQEEDANGGEVRQMAHQLQHSFSMPARFDAAAAAAGVLASPHGSMQQLAQQEAAAGSPAGYGDVFRSLWGSTGGSSQK